MIVADRKDINEIFEFIKDYKKVLVLGCNECVTVCQVGGEKEVNVLAQALRLKSKTSNKEIEFIEDSIKRQCEHEFVTPVIENYKNIDAIVTLACGVGVNFLAESIGNIAVFPGVDTTFMGATVEHGVWEERCAGCGQCILHLTGGICPIARCSKTLLNGPCGGTNNGMCEISTPDHEVPCVWTLIIERMKKLGRLEELSKIQPPKNWSTSRHGGPRRRIRADLRLNKKEVKE